MRIRKYLYMTLGFLLYIACIVPGIRAEAADEVAKIGNAYYPTVSAALDAAQPGQKVILQKNAVLDKNAVVKSGVVLVLPTDGQDGGYNPQGYNPYGSYASNPTRYLTLTVPSNVSLTVKGTVLVNAVTGIKNSGAVNGYDVSGGYSTLDLQGSLQVESGGLLDVYGYVTGNGNIRAYSGGTVRDLYVVRRWRGGTYASAAVSPNNIFPFNEYDMHNIQVTTRIDYGASLTGNVRMYANSEYYDTRFPQINHKNGLYRLKPGGYAVKSYIGGRETLKFYGGGSFASSSLEFMGVTRSTNSFVFPVDGDCTIELNSGTYQYASSFKYMPGAQVIVNSNATLNIPKSAGPIKQVKAIFYEGSFRDYYTANGTAYPSSRGSATLYVYGKLHVYGVLVGNVLEANTNCTVLHSGYVSKITTKESGSVIGSRREFTVSLSLTTMAGKPIVKPDDGNSGGSDGGSGGGSSVSKAKPSTPSGLKASVVSGNYLKISWRKSSRVSKYVVYRATSKKGKYKKLAVTSKTYYTDKKATVGKTFYYKVVAQRASGKKTYSSASSKIISKKAVPLAPSTVKASSGKKKVALKWSTVKNVSGYQVYRSTRKSSGYKKVADTRKRSYTDKKAKSKKTYYYKVRAYKKVSGKKIYGSFSKVIRKAAR